MKGVKMGSRLINIDEAAARLGITKGTLYHWVSDERINHVKMGKRVFFKEASVDEFIEKNTVYCESAKLVW
jgi:excisionase family DNA binding protein